MRFWSPIVLLPFVVLSPLVAAHLSAPQRRHHVRDLRTKPLVARAGAEISNDTLASISSAEAFSSSSLSAFSTTQVSSAAVTSSVTSSVSAQEDDTSSGIPSTQEEATTTATASVVVIPSSSSTSETIVVVTSSALPSSAEAVVSTIPYLSDTAPSTLSSIIITATSTVTRSIQPSVVTATRTASSSSSASADASKEGAETKSGGINKTTLIIIIVVASVVGLAAIGWTAFRKWKLSPSRRFDEKMKPIDFSPRNDAMGDDFLEKTLERSSSHNSLDRQRQQLVSELDDPNHVAGIPEHDFTAGTHYAGGAQYDSNMYNHDPFAHSRSYDYDEAYQGHQYPPHAALAHADYPTQDQTLTEGYADLQRGNSVGSGDGHSQGHGYGQRQVHPLEFPMPDQYLGRPTGGSEGPYAQAAQYRY